MLRKQLEFDANPASPDYDTFSAASYAALLGDKDQAFKFLEKGYQDQHGMLFLKVEPELDNIRSDPRYSELLRRVGLAQ